MQQQQAGAVSIAAVRLPTAANAAESHLPLWYVHQQLCNPLHGCVSVSVPLAMIEVTCRTGHGRQLITVGLMLTLLLLPLLPPK
jgi:hypothetical protein